MTNFPNEENFKILDLDYAMNKYSGKGVKILVREGLQKEGDKNTILSDNFYDSTTFSTLISEHAMQVASLIKSPNQIQDFIIANHSMIDFVQSNFTHNPEGYDIENNSWNYIGNINCNDYGKYNNSDIFNLKIKVQCLELLREKLINKFVYENNSEKARDGLGKIIIFGAGNDGSSLTANLQDVLNQQINFAIAAVSRVSIDENNNVRNNDWGIEDNKNYLYDKLSHGSAILASAPGSEIVTHYYSNETKSIISKNASGSSFAAPIVSAIVALMLESNPNLGWRDVQEIIVHSTKSIDDMNYNLLNDWSYYYQDLFNEQFYVKQKPSLNEPESYNNAQNHNLCGMHFSRQSGFGMINAEAAVRLAESWPLQQTSKNLFGICIEDRDVEPMEFFVNEDFQVEHVTVRLDISLKSATNSLISFVMQSPSGTKSILYRGSESAKSIKSFHHDDEIILALSSKEFFGEPSLGLWEIKVIQENYYNEVIDRYLPEFFAHYLKYDVQSEKLQGEFAFNISGKDPEQEKQLIITNEIFSDMKKNGLEEIIIDHDFAILNLAALSHENVVVDFNNSEISLNGQKVKLVNMDQSQKIILNTNNNVVHDNEQVHDFVVFSGESTINFSGESDKVTFLSSEKLQGVHNINGVQNWTEQVSFANENIEDFLITQDFVQFAGEDWEININHE